jgi:ABC-type uncharacterized transport system involved in gliding motility auxiliary subunit
MRKWVELPGYAGIVFLAAAGLVRLVFIDSGVLSLALLVVGVVLFLVYFFRAEHTVQRFLGRRSTREGGNVLGTGLFVVGIVILVNVLASNFALRVDVTADKLFTLAPETATALRQLPVAPKVWVFYPENTPTAFQLGALLEAAQDVEPDLEFHIVDPGRDPLKFMEFELRDLATVVEVGERHETFVGSREEDFLGAMIKASNVKKQYVGFLKGHGEAVAFSGEPEGMRRAAEALNQRGLAPFRLNILSGRSLSESLDVVVIAGPETELSGMEVDSLVTFMSRGGRLLVLLDPAWPVSLPEILGLMGLSFDPRLLADPEQLDPQLIRPSEYSNHPVVWVLARRAVEVVLFGAGEVTVESKRGILQAPLLRSGRRTGLAGEPTAETRSRTLGAAAEWKGIGDEIGRMVVIGDADFATNRHYETLANADLFLSAVQWLAERESRIELRPREQTNRPIVLTRQQGKALMVLVVGILPFMVLLTGSVVWWKRR